MNLFVTGTDTGVGKTYVCKLLIEALRNRGESVFPWKPVCCGDRDDARILLQAAGLEEDKLDEVNPLWLKTAAAPYAAGLIENRQVDVGDLVDRCRKLEGRFDHLVVEGAGGWEVPMTKEETLADFAGKLGLPVVVVVDNKLGALNHTILTVRNIEGRGLKCLGLILNHAADERDAASISNPLVLNEVLGVPILADLMHGSDELEMEKIAELLEHPA